MCLHEHWTLSEVPEIEAFIAFEQASRGDLDGAIATLRAAVDDVFDAGQFGWCIPLTGMFVETLLTRGGEADLQEAQTAIERLAAARTTKWWTARSGCCGCARCWPAPAATRPPTMISAGDTAPWPRSLADWGTWRCLTRGLSALRRQAQAEYYLLRRECPENPCGIRLFNGRRRRGGARSQIRRSWPRNRPDGSRRILTQPPCPGAGLRRGCRHHRSGADQAGLLSCAVRTRRLR
jgi:hypothetical protein